MDGWVLTLLTDLDHFELRLISCEHPPPFQIQFKGLGNFELGYGCFAFVMELEFGALDDDASDFFVFIIFYLLLF